MTWNEVAAIILSKMNEDEGRETARIDIQNEGGAWVTERAIKLVKDTFGVWTFVISGGNDDE